MDKRIIGAIDAQIRTLKHARKVLVGLGLGKRVAGSSIKPKRSKISAAGRKRIAAAQRARWAKIRAVKKK